MAKSYTLTIIYRSGMVARFDYTPQQLLWEMAIRILANESNPDVKSWVIDPQKVTTEEILQELKPDPWRDK